MRSFTRDELEAERLRECWVVRPKGSMGTIGWWPRPWTAQFVKAPTADKAISKAMERANA